MKNPDLCQAKLSTWLYEVKVTSFESEPHINFNFGTLSFSSKDNWGYTGEFDFFEFSNENGTSWDLPFTDDNFFDDLSMASRNGELNASWEDAELFMRVISTGSEIKLSREIISESGKQKVFIMSATQEGGDVAMNLIQSCRFAQ